MADIAREDRSLTVLKREKTSKSHQKSSSHLKFSKKRLLQRVAIPRVLTAFSVQRAHRQEAILVDLLSADGVELLVGHFGHFLGLKVQFVKLGSVVFVALEQVAGVFEPDIIVVLKTEGD